MKIRKSKQVQANSYQASKHAPTSINHKTVKTHDKWMGLKPWQTLRCLQFSCQISHPSNKALEFHKPNTNMYHKKSTNDQTGEKIPIK